MTEKPDVLAEALTVELREPRTLKGVALRTTLVRRYAGKKLPRDVDWHAWIVAIEDEAAAAQPEPAREAHPAPPSEGLREALDAAYPYMDSVPEHFLAPLRAAVFARIVTPSEAEPEPADWAANGLAALDHLEELFWSGSGLTAASWDAATDAIRAALTPAKPSAGS